VWLALLAAAVFLHAPAPSIDAAAYRYKDSNGQWVYTDRPPEGATTTQPVTLSGRGGDSTPRMTVVARSTEQGVALYAVNDCQCPVEFGARVRTAGGELTGRAVVAARSESRLLDVPVPTGGVPGTTQQIRFEYGYIVGEPNVEHRPPRPYRAPFALAQQYLVSQAPPDSVTHGDLSSRNAIDFAMPEGSAVHAAREGVVINVARRFFRGGVEAKNVDEANFVQILHDDGTYAVYAHLQLDTVRVRPGQRVARGEYIANSGNTGYSSGPHLHFVVLRNVGMAAESLPVTFYGPGGQTLTARSGTTLTAY
jgi:murein DD-endopeptidase MepM/ murein hydrolase activator NlpD